MQQTGQEPPEKADGEKSGEKSFQSILQKCGLGLFAPQHFYYSRNVHLKENCLDHLGQKDVINKYWLMRSSDWLSNVHFQPRKPMVPWATSKAMRRAGQGRGFCPSVPSGKNPSGALHPTLGLPTQKGHGSVGTSPGKRQEDALRAGAPLLWRHTERLGVF